MSRRLRSMICWMLVCATCLSPIAAQAQVTVAQNQSTDGSHNENSKPDQGTDRDDDARRMLAYVPTGANIIALVRPRFVLTHASMERMPLEIFSAVGKRDFGIDPLDIEAAVIVAEVTPAGPPAVGAVLRLRDPSATLTMTPAPPYVHTSDGILIVASTPAFGEAIKSSPQGAKSVLAGTMSEAPPMDVAATVDVANLRPLLQAAVAQAPPLPPPLESLKRTPQLVSRVDLNLRVTERPGAALHFIANSESDAETLDAIARQSLEVARALMMQQVTAEIQGNDAVQVASQQYATRIINSIFELVQFQRAGNRVSFAAESNESSQVATMGVLVGLLLPAIQAAREAARRAQAINQIKQLSLAMLNYEADKQQYPARSSFDADGKALLSWRVHLLPYLGENELYKQFQLDEPWDSDHNRTLIGKMPAIYANPNLAEVGRTNFLAPVGAGTVFEGNEGLAIRKIQDGTSKTILLVEANADKSVIWTQPMDLDVDLTNPLNGLGSLRNGGFVASRCDGSVHFVEVDIDPTTLAALFTCAAGDVVVER